jgi:hypothetical protein
MKVDNVDVALKDKGDLESSTLTPTKNASPSMYYHPLSGRYIHVYVHVYRHVNMCTYTLKNIYSNKYKCINLTPIKNASPSMYYHPLLGAYLCIYI